MMGMLLATIIGVYTFDIQVEASEITNSEDIEQLMKLTENEFKDVPASNSAAIAIQWALSEGIVKGFEDATFRPNVLLTEAQFAAMLTRYYTDLNKEASKYTYLDEKVWSNSTYEAMARYQVPLLGYLDRTYRNKPIMRGLLAQAISHVNGATYELEGAVHYLFDEKITAGQNLNATTLLDKYGYKNNLTRAQAVVFFHRMHQQGKRNVVTEKVVVQENTPDAEKMKNRAISRVNPKVKPGAMGYIEGQTLPVKPTYIKDTLITNKKFPLPKNYAPGENKIARTAFNKMVVEAKKSGIKLVVFSTYRSFDYQTMLYNKYVKLDGRQAADRYSAKPGYSEHQTGLAFDIGEVNESKHWASASFGKTMAGKWLAANAHRYGFIMRYPEGKENSTGYMHESWHFRFVGKGMATDIAKRKITLEEYLGI